MKSLNQPKALSNLKKPIRPQLKLRNNANLVRSLVCLYREILFLPIVMTEAHFQLFNDIIKNPKKTLSPSYRNPVMTIAFEAKNEFEKDYENLFGQKEGCLSLNDSNSEHEANGGLSNYSDSLGGEISINENN